MNTTMILLLAAVCAVAALFAGLWIAARRESARLAAGIQASEAARHAEKAEFQQQLDQARRDSEALRTASQAELRQEIERRTTVQSELAAARAAADTELAALRRQSAENRETERREREKREEILRLQFKQLAADILGEQSRQFKETNRESLDILLKPFRENIVDFRERVERIYADENQQRGSLRTQLEHLMELNHRITTETVNLTNALKGNSKVQGDWGEVLLETILEGSSLIRGIHYETQYNFKDEEGNNLRPDVVLHLPEKKEIVIDSKVSLTAYVDYTAADDEAERSRLLAAHVTSVRQHVRELGKKSYQRLLNAPDFVIMFIPNEPAFLEALKADHNIWSDAYREKVIISSPTNLFAMLKIVADLWKYNDQDKYAQEIADCALKLYEQAVAFAASLEGVGAALGKAREAYDEAVKRLSTGNNNMVRVGERLRKRASLQTKRRFSARALEMAGEEEGFSPEAAAEPQPEVEKGPDGPHNALTE